MKKTAMATLTKKGQTTIPKNIREYLGINPNDKIEFVIDNSGVVEIKPVGSLEANFGRVKAHHKPEKFQRIRRKYEEKVAYEQVKKGSKI